MNVLDEEIQKEVDKFTAREEAVAKRVSQLRIIHEDVIIINRLDNLETLTFLAVAEKTRNGYQKDSWYGKVLKISEVGSGDTVRDQKKAELLKVGDIVSFNPDSAYSLNVANFKEIWILHVDNILVVDLEYNYLESMKENLQKRLEVQQAIQMHNLSRASVARNNMANSGMKKN